MMRNMVMCLGSLALCGCAATMKVNVSIADPTGVSAIRQEAIAHQVCSSILNREDSASLDAVRASLQSVARPCSEALLDKANGIGDAAEQSMLRSEAEAVASIDDELDSFARDLESSRDVLERLLFSTAADNADPCEYSGRHAAELMKHQARRHKSLDQVNGVLADLQENCGLVPELKPALNAASLAVAGHQSLIGGGSLSRSDYAYAVAKLDENRWRHFNQAKGNAHGGNLDLAIKMNEPGDFTVKGMRFDATKTAEVVGKSFVQLLLLSAGRTGHAVTSTTAPPNTALAPHNAMASEQAKQVVREAMMSAYRAAAADIALMLIAESSPLNGSQSEREQAIAAIKSIVSSSKARLDLATLP